jgi:predicted DCC family thiol-disulfide oxidoreductase YuxK
MTDRLDAWIHGGAISRTSLARYRILYALVALAMLPDFAWVSAFPDSVFRPPPGPFQLFSGFPPSWVMHGLEGALAVCLVAVLIGWRTRTASFAAVVVAMTGYGFCYSLGKIDHDVLLVLVPAPLALAGWGDRLSLDAVRRTDRSPDLATHWPLRLFALTIGLAFLTATADKVRGGWLDPRTHAVLAAEVMQDLTDASQLPVPLHRYVTSPVLWEVLDVVTIVFEAGMVVAVLTWASTRLWFAVATAFHVGVWLTLGIPFFMNVVAYGFVVPWDRVPVRESVRQRALRFRPSSHRRWTAPLVVLGGGAAWAALVDAFARTPSGGGPTRLAAVLYPALLVLGALVGTGYLLQVARGTVRALRDPGDAASGRLIYDADCGFCTTSARWLARRRPERVTIAPWQALPDLATLGLDERDVTERAYWQDASGALRPGHEAIAAGMVARGGLARPAGRAIGSAWLAPVAAAAYRWVATHRYAMPGATDACKMPAPPDSSQSRENSAERSPGSAHPRR